MYIFAPVPFFWIWPFHSKVSFSLHTNMKRESENQQNLNWNNQSFSCLSALSLRFYHLLRRTILIFISPVISFTYILQNESWMKRRMAIKTILFIISGILWLYILNILCYLCKSYQCSCACRLGNPNHFGRLHLTL